MIPMVRINALHFLGSDMEEAIWDVIKDAKEKCKREFRINFHVNSQASLIKLTKACQHHLESLQIKTKIQLEKNSKKEFAFLNVDSNNNNESFINYRFAYTAPSPYNIVGAMNFLIAHFEFINNTPHKDMKKQKRNDSTTFDYNKR